MGTSPVDQSLRFCASMAGGTSSISGQGPEILHAEWCGGPPKNKTKTTMKPITPKKKKSKEYGFRSVWDMNYNLNSGC